MAVEVLTKKNSKFWKQFSVLQRGNEENKEKINKILKTIMATKKNKIVQVSSDVTGYKKSGWGPVWV